MRQLAQPARALALAGLLVSGSALALLPGCGGGDTAVAGAHQVDAALQEKVSVGSDVASFYQARAFRPLWVGRSGLKPEAHQLLSILSRSDRDGLDPARYGVRRLIAAFKASGSGDRAALAQAELLLSRGFADYVLDLRQPPEDPGMVFIDPELAPPRLTTSQVLEDAASAKSLGAHLAAVRRMNPIYEGLRRGLAMQRARSISACQEQLIRANLERARVIPANPGRRYIVVDAAGARLWLYEDGQVRDSMRVIVGKPGQETPMLAGLIRFAVLNPYWNVPPDIVQTRIAPGVLREGTGHLQRERMEVLSDWSPTAHVIDPAGVDWSAVARGTYKLRVRQLPGRDNMMGNVKFMMPNRLGIYLHDTPDKGYFTHADRRISSGCVRVEDAQRLARWLFGGIDVRASSPAPEQRVDLPSPVPVYITYLTALPTAEGIAFQRDVYRRDPALLAHMEQRRTRKPLPA